MSGKKIYIVSIKGSSVIGIYDDDAKAWRNAKRVASSYDEIDIKNSTQLDEYRKYGDAYFFTKEGMIITIQSDCMNPEYKGEVSADA